MPDTESHRRLRTLFYDRVGLSDRTNVSGTDVSEKTRLRELLAQTPLPVARLTDFCCRYKMPDQYRQLVWKLVLNIVPRLAENCNFVREKRDLQFWDAWRSLLAIRLESIDWCLVEEPDDVSSFVRLSKKLRQECQSLGVGIERSHCIIDDLAETCTSVRFVCTPDPSSYIVQSFRSPQNYPKHSLSPEKNNLLSPCDGSVFSDDCFLSPGIVLGPITPTPVPVVSSSARIQRRNSCTADVGLHSRAKRREMLSSGSKEFGHRKSGTETNYSILSPVNKVRENSFKVENGVEEYSQHTAEDMQLDANIHGVFILKKHYIGFTPSNAYLNKGWDYDAVEIPTELAVPSLVDNLIMWLMNRDRICFQSYTTQIVNGPETAAYLCIGRHINCDSMEESYILRCSVWDLVSKNKSCIVDSVLTSGRRMLNCRNSGLAQILESFSFFDSHRLSFFALSLFSNILSPVAAEKVLDKVIAESFEFVSYLSVELLLQAQQALAAACDRRQAILILSQMKHSETDYAVNAALELFHKEYQ